MNKNLKYFKMIGVLFVILVDLLAEQGNRIANEQMCNVLGQKMIDTSLPHLIVCILIDHQWDVIIPERIIKKIRGEHSLLRLTNTSRHPWTSTNRSSRNVTYRYDICYFSGVQVPSLL